MKVVYMIVMTALITFSTQVSASGLTADFVPGEILMQYKQGSSKNAVSTLQGKMNVLVKQKFKSFGIEHWKLPKGMDVKAAIANLNKDPNVAFAEPNYRRYSSAAPNDPSFAEQWGLQNTGQVVNGAPSGVSGADMGLVAAWNTTTGSANVIVAVIDDSVDINHEDLYANIWTNTGEIAGDGIDNDGNGYIDDVHGWDFVNFDNDPSADPYTDEGHGTMVSGCLGAVGNNGIGISGVSQVVSIMPIKFGLDVATELSAIQYAIDNGAHIVNMSFGGFDSSIAEENAMNSLEAAGILVVAAAGNSDFNNDMLASYPASYSNPNIISVAASAPTGALTSWTQYGATSVDIAAPGQDIYTTTSPTTSNGLMYDFVDGTSFSAPYVAGIAALVKAQYPTATYQEMKGRILAGATRTISMRGLLSTSASASASGALNAVAQSVVSIQSVMISDDNGWIEPGETINLDFNLENVWQNATGVTATLTALSSNITVSTNTKSYSDLNAGSALGSGSGFALTAASSATGYQTYKFKLDISANGGAHPETRYYQVGMGNLNYDERYQGTIQLNDQDDTQVFRVKIPDTGKAVTFSTTSAQDIDLIVSPIALSVSPVALLPPDLINSDTGVSEGVTGNEFLQTNTPSSAYYVLIHNYSQTPTLPYTVTVESLTPTLTPTEGGGGCFAPSFSIGMLPMLFLLGLLFWVSKRKRI